MIKANQKNTVHLGAQQMVPLPLPPLSSHPSFLSLLTVRMIMVRVAKAQAKKKKKKKKEFPLWCNGIGRVSTAPGHRFNPQPGTVDLRIWCCPNCDGACSCGLDPIPGPGTPRATGRPKKERIKKKIQAMRQAFESHSVFPNVLTSLGLSNPHKMEVILPIH